jgi:hypothetical protein
MRRCCWLVLLALALGGCSSTVTSGPPSPATSGLATSSLAASSQPTDYVTLVTSQPITTKLKGSTTAPLEISALRPVTLPQPGAWVGCVRAWKDEKPIYMAYFFNGDKVVDYRGGILFDRCEQQDYSPLQPGLPQPQSLR